jgi:hypothetical protein
LVRQ